MIKSMNFLYSLFSVSGISYTFLSITLHRLLLHIFLSIFAFD